MASVIPGYNYDIFISYRQKDNKGDNWVSHFVDTLKTELEATFKEDISMYFDVNPHDGLLETHDVEESLKEKLKCLVFIPIISRTYCDPKSFAWEHEFKAFVEQASKDQLGLKVKLPNGNVTSRVLPIQIYDLDVIDIKACESIIGRFIRGVEFIYKEPGVNRPLTPGDPEAGNLNKTNYRNQINKVSNAIREIIFNLKTGQLISPPQHKEIIPTHDNNEIFEKSIAVLPFVNMSSEKDQDYFCDGITEEIISALSHIKDFKVIARTSAFAFKDKKVDIREIGRILNVENLLEGSIRKTGSRLRITAQLIKAADGIHIWSERYDREMRDIFDIQDEISQAITDNLKVKLLNEPKSKTAKRYSENLEAYNLYLRGNYFFQKFTPEGIIKASECYEQALRKDPDFALAYVGLANINGSSSFWGNIRPHEALPKVNEYINKALVLDNTLGEAYWMLGNINAFYYWNWKEADCNFKKALAIIPNSSIVHLDYSQFLAYIGHSEEAIYQVNKAMELDPLSGNINTFAGVSFLSGGQYNRAIKEFKIALTINPNFFFTYFQLGLVYLSKGKFKEALSEMVRAAELSGGNPFITAWLISLYYKVGEKYKADGLFESLKKKSDSAYVPSTSFFLVHNFRGEENEAVWWLERACTERDTFLVPLKRILTLFPEGLKYVDFLVKRGLDY